VSSLLFTTLLHAAHTSLAVHVDLPRREIADLSSLFSRASNGTSTLDSANGSYSINITLGGKAYSVMIDSGSSDLWVAGAVPGAKDTGATAQITYAVGSAQGPVKTADLTILGYTVKDQAYIEVDVSSDAPDGTGLIGFGPSTGSQVLQAIANSTGDPPLDRIFRQNTSIPNYITVALNRPKDTTEDFTGQMTISEILPEFQNISSQTKVPVTILDSRIATDQHFSILLDSDGIIGPDGNTIKTTSNASYAPSHDNSQLVAIFDTGFSLPQFPQDVVNKIYSSVQGAQLTSIPSFHGDVWVVDCQAEVNVTLKIGGQPFPLHPLDVTRKETDDNGRDFCYGTLQTRISGAQDPTYDVILGMTVLSNMYLLLDYGDFVDGSTSNKDAPYIQAVSTTDVAEGHKDFVEARLSGKDTTTPHGSSSNGNNNNNNKSQGFFRKYRIPIFIGAAVAGFAALSGAVWFVTRRRKRVYRPLFEPAPAGDMQMQYVTGYNTGGQYADPWNHRR